MCHKWTSQDLPLCYFLQDSPGAYSVPRQLGVLVIQLHSTRKRPLTPFFNQIIFCENGATACSSPSYYHFFCVFNWSVPHWELQIFDSSFWAQAPLKSVTWLKVISESKGSKIKFRIFPPLIKSISTSACNTSCQSEEKWKGKSIKMKQNKLSKMHLLKIRTTEPRNGLWFSTYSRHRGNHLFM